MKVHVGDVVYLSDNRCAYVTDVPEDENEHIFIAYEVHPELWHDPQLGEPGYSPVSFAWNEEEVVEILELASVQ